MKILPQVIKTKTEDAINGKVMSRKPISVILFTLVLIGLLNSALKIQPIEVAVCSGYEVNLAKAALFLNSTQFDSTVGLCREAPNVHNNTFWFVSDNLLAYHALRYYYPETAEVVYATMLGYGYFRSFKHEVLFGTTIPYIPFQTNNTYVVAQIGTKFIETEVCNGSSIDDYKEYADLCIFAALHFYWSGDISQAIDHFNMAKNMWNGTLHGVYDKASEDAESEGERLVFSTYKLSLLLYCSRILGQPLEDKTSIEETLWLMQDGEYGGLHTDYDIGLNYTGSDMNTETTSIAILAYMYEPKIVNRPVQYPPPLNIPPDYQKIQEAVNSANEGDIVFVKTGTYYENVVVNKTVSLIGESKDTTVVNGAGSLAVFKVTTDFVTIKNFMIQDGFFGIYVANSGSNTISENNFISCSGRGLYLEFSENNFIDGNTLYNNKVGILLAWSCNNSLKHNDIANNDVNFVVTGNELLHFIQDIDISNTVDGKPIYYWVNENDKQVPTTAGYVAIVNSTRIKVKDLILAKNGEGVMFAFTSNSIVENVTASNNFEGISLLYSHSNKVQRNTASKNNDGIYLRQSDNNTINTNILINNTYGIYSGWYSCNNVISGNTISSNKWGVLLGYSNGNVFCNNNFIENEEQVSKGSYNFSEKWDDGYPSGGNYWSDHDGTDSDYDGIGDTPYFIDANNQDNYPLMGMFSSFNTSYGYAVDFVSNSSISDVSFNLTPIQAYSPINLAVLAFNVSGETGTDGFLRVCIPKILISGLYLIMFDDLIITKTTYPQVRELPCSNETYEYLYINYTHSKHNIIIQGLTLISEFPSFLMLPLCMIATLLVVMVYRRKKEKS